jgi:threonine dehydratase
MIAKASFLVLYDNEAGSYKYRGAFSRTNRLVERADAKGQPRPPIITSSAGNAGIGVELAAREFELEGAVYVPTSIPEEKYQALLNAAAGTAMQVIKQGSVFSETYQIAKAAPGKFIEPYDHPDVMAGQGTIVDDALEQAPDTTALVVPVGGGGLIGGVARRLQQLGREDIRVYGAEAPGSNGMSRSIQAGSVVEATAPSSYFGGLAVNQPGQHPFEVVRRSPNVSFVQTTMEGIRYTAANYLELHEIQSGVLEPSTAVALEALRHLHLAGQLKSKDHALVLGTGRNENLANLFQERGRSNNTIHGYVGSRAA